MTDLERYADELRAELGAMTAKELRGYASEHHVTLGYATTKAAMRGEIVAQMRHREYLRRCAEMGVRP